MVSVPHFSIAYCIWISRVLLFIMWIFARSASDGFSNPHISDFSSLETDYWHLKHRLSLVRGLIHCKNINPLILSFFKRGELKSFNFCYKLIITDDNVGISRISRKVKSSTKIRFNGASKGINLKIVIFSEIVL